MKEKFALENDSNPLEKPTSYRIKDKIFVVEPVFRNDGRETLGAILLRLMQKDIEEP